RWPDRVFAQLETPVEAAGTKHGKGKILLLSKPKVVVSPGAATTIAKGTQIFYASVTNSKGDPLTLKPSQKFKWNSSNKGVATIDSDGLATGVANGSTTITAAVTVGSLDVQGTATLTVSDQCDGITSISTLSGTLDYDYQGTGTFGIAKINSTYHAA